MADEQGRELVAEWGEQQTNGTVYVYQQFADGTVELARIESWGQNQGTGGGGGSAQVSPSIPMGGGAGYPVVSNPAEILPWYQQWMAEGGSGNPQEFIEHFQRLFHQTPDMSALSGGGPGGLVSAGPQAPQAPNMPGMGNMNIATNLLEMQAANEAARIGLERSRGGLSDWLNVTQAPFNSGLSRSSLMNQIANTMGWWPNNPGRFGVPDVPNYTPPEWLQNWLGKGYVGG